jgi:hypothetical protein
LRRPRFAFSFVTYTLEELRSARIATRLFDSELAPGDGVVPELFCGVAVVPFPRDVGAAGKSAREQARGTGVSWGLLDDGFKQSLRGSTVGLGFAQ